MLCPPVVLQGALYANKDEVISTRRTSLSTCTRLATLGNRNVLSRSGSGTVMKFSNAIDTNIISTLNNVTI